MTDSIREVVEGLLGQGVDESIVYTIDSSPWGGAPVSPTAVIKDEQDSFSDVTVDVATGTASANGDTILSPEIHSLIAGKIYRVEIAYTSGGNTLEIFFRIKAEV